MSYSKKAVIYSDTKPDKQQSDKILEFISKNYGNIPVTYVKDNSINDGFILKVNDEIIDWTNKGRAKQLFKNFSIIDTNENIISLLHKAIDDYKSEIVSEEIGTVLTVGDGIATVQGLTDAQYAEILVFESGAKGMVQVLKENELGCILFDPDNSVTQGMSVKRTFKTAGIPVGNSFLGRVIDSLGSPIDGLGPIESDDYRQIESKAPGIIERSPVKAPLETGILAIDSMFPIGRGQRELIIGDRQTGKTTIAVDTIINQKNKNVICIYVAIGQKNSSVASTVNLLKQHNAMDYTVVINSGASDSAPLQYIAPYSGCCLAEFFMHQGKDVLIVYDDLSKHAIAYRTISLLLGRSSGREAYPGDIFYLHSRLLERSAHLSDENGGGSITALPIVETQAGDVSAYIPTNIISITDGQIFLESDMFFEGQRPAVNIGLSVSRVGGDAQSKVMKKSCGTLRLDLAQYREMAVFTQFSGDLEQSTAAQLKYGKGLMEVLKQKQHLSLSRHEEVILLTAGLSHCFDNISIERIDTFKTDICRFVEEKANDICLKIDEKGIINEDEKKLLSELCLNYLNYV